MENIKELEEAASTLAERVKAVSKSPSFKQYIIYGGSLKNIYCSVFLPAYCYKYDSMVFSPNCRFDMKLVLKEATREQISAEFHSRTQGMMNEQLPPTSLYTDGSTLEKNGSFGAGIFSPELGLSESYSLPSELSIFSAEAWALLEAVIHQRMKVDRGCDIH